MDTSKAVILSQQEGFMSEEHRRVAAVIQDFDPTLKVVFVPPELRHNNDNEPFALVHSPFGLPPYVVRRLNYNELDERLLAWLFQSDNTKHDVLSKMEADHAAREALKLREQMDEMAEARDVAASIIKSPLNTFKHDGHKYQ